MASPYIFEKHDFGVLRSDGTTKVGMMLAKNKDGTPLFQVFDDEYLASQFFTGTPGYGSLPAEKELAIRQEDWRSGFGLEIYDSNDTKRYFSSIGMDMRFRGMAIAGPTPTTVTKPTSGLTNPATISNQGFEDGLTGWTTVNITQSATQKHSGTYSAKITDTGSSIKTDYFEVTWQSEYQSKEFIFKMWIYTTDLANVGCSIGIGDGQTITWSADDTSTNTWTLLSVTKTLAGNASELKLYVEVDDTGAGSATTYFDDAQLQATVGFLGKPVAKAEFNDELYIAHGSFLSKLNGAGTAFTSVKANFPGVITDLQVFQVSGTSYLFIMLGTSTPYWYMTTAEVFTESTVTSMFQQYAVWVHTTVDTMYANDGANTIRSTVDPLNGGTAWSAQTIVGAAEHNIQMLLDKSGALYIPKEDMIYYLDPSGNVQNNAAPRLAALTSSTSGKNVLTDGQIIMYPAGAQVLLEIDGSTLTWRNPSDYCTNLTDFVGRIQGLGFDEAWWFAVVDNSGKVEVLAGRKETIDSTTSWVWHPIAEITLTNCKFSFVSSIYQKRLWVMSDTASESIYYVPLPTGYGDITNDANRLFKTGTTMETSWFHGNFKDTTKAWPELTVVMSHAYDADIYFTVEYKKLGDSTWTTIGNFTGSATSMSQSRYIPVDGSSNNPVSTMFKLQFTAVTDDTNKTPVLIGFHLKGILYPAQREIFACKVRVADEVVLKDGTIDKGSYDELIDTLNEARTATWPITFYDIDGTTQTGKPLPMPSGVPRWELLKDEKGRRTQERYYNLLIQKVALS